MSYNSEILDIGNDYDQETIQKILQDLEANGLSCLNDTLGENFGEHLDLDSAGPSQQNSSQNRNPMKTKPFSESTFFRLALILTRKYGTSPSTRDNLLTVFKEANRRRQRLVFFYYCTSMFYLSISLLYEVF